MNYIYPPNDAYYVLLPAGACRSCVAPGTTVVTTAHVVLQFPTACSQPVEISIVGATIDACCRKPDPASVLSPPTAYTLAPALPGIYDFALPIPGGCVLTGDAFLCVNFVTDGAACATLATRPRLMTTAECVNCQNYNIYPSGNDDLCALAFPGTLSMYVDATTCAATTAIITASAGPGGTIMPSGAVSVPGTNPLFTIAADPGYTIHDVMADGSRVAGYGQSFQYLFGPSLPVNNHTICAHFCPPTLAITALAGPGGSIFPDFDYSTLPGGLCGRTVTYAIEPDACYTVADVLVDGVSVGPVTSYRFADVGENHTIAVSFRHLQYTITASAGAGGTITPGGTMNCGANETFLITPDGCHTINSVVVDGEVLGPVASYTFQRVATDHEIAASFDPIPAFASDPLCLGPHPLTVTPATGGDGGFVTATISGRDLASGGTVRLTRSGQTDIAGTALFVTSDGTTLTATFDLRGRLRGAWSVVVTNPDNRAATMPGAFTIVAASAPQLSISIIGPATLRPDRQTAYDLVLTNGGNSDALVVPLWVTGLPPGTTVAFDFPLTTPPRAVDEPDWSLAPTMFDGPDGRRAALVIPRFPPGTTTRRILITAPAAAAGPFRLGAALGRSWTDDANLRGCLQQSGVISNPVCIGQILTQVNGALASTPGAQATNAVALWAKVAFRCEATTSLSTALAKALVVVGFLAPPDVDTPILAICRPVLSPIWQTALDAAVVTSSDPNDKLGPPGWGAARAIPGQQPLVYAIRCENAESATAPAQEVVIGDALDLATLDPGTLSLGPMRLGAAQLIPPPGARAYTATVDLRPARDLLVRVAAGLDEASGVLSWRFTSIDPATGQPPAGPLAGFLPPNALPPQGEASVLFSVNPRTALPSGTVIRNRARIVFDTNPAVTTHEWTNTLDAAPPASRVLALPAAQESTTFAVHWEGTGDIGDLRDFTILVSEDAGEFRVWRQNVTATADTFAAVVGHQYAFYSVARDSSGNLEAPPAQADAVTLVVPPVVVDFDLKPEKLKLDDREMHKRVEATLTPPPPYSALDIVVSSIRLNGVVGVDATEPPKIHEHGGVLELAVTFRRGDLSLILPAGDHVPVVVTGQIGTHLFMGTDTVKVKRGKVHTPHVAETLVPGSRYLVQYDIASGEPVQRVTLLSSVDRGLTWTTQAAQQPNTGSIAWQVPGVAAESVLVAVVEVEAGGDSSDVVGVLGVSDYFSIAGTLGVEDAPAALMLEPARPNPSARSLSLRFGLTRGGPVRLGVFDLQGRLVRRLVSSVQEPGWHEATWDGESGTGAPAGPGLYFLSLEAEGRTLTQRIVRLR